MAKLTEPNTIEYQDPNNQNNPANGTYVFDNNTRLGGHEGEAIYGVKFTPKGSAESYYVQLSRVLIDGKYQYFMAPQASLQPIRLGTPIDQTIFTEGTKRAAPLQAKNPSAEPPEAAPEPVASITLDRNYAAQNGATVGVQYTVDARAPAAKGSSLA
jgi:hypothetical protein